MDGADCSDMAGGSGQAEPVVELKEDKVVEGDSVREDLSRRREEMKLNLAKVNSIY